MEETLINEQWKSIEDFPNYKVSTEGRVKSYYSGKILKSLPTWNGYLMVHLYNDGKMTTKQIHRIVAQTFIPNPDKLPFIDHINGVKTDNRLCNLRWCTKKENANFDNHKPMSEKLKAILRKCYYRNRESILEQLKQYYQDNRESRLEQRKQYYQNNKEQISEQLKLYYQANRESILEQAKHYREAHKEQHKDYMKLYYQANKEKWQNYKHNKSRKA